MMILKIVYHKRECVIIAKVPVKLSFGEEVANAITHGVSAIIVLICIPIVAIIAHDKGTISDVVGVTIFSISIFLMFLISTLYHAMEHDTKHKEIFHVLDHVFIYVAIAGTYTPIALSVIGGWVGILVLLLQWGTVLFGILYKSLSKNRLPKASLMIYLVMAWSAVLFMPLIFRNANPVLFWMILAGGVFYSSGAAIYAKKAFKYHHMVWHILVFLGALTHFIGICFFLYK